MGHSSYQANSSVSKTILTKSFYLNLYFLIVQTGVQAKTIQSFASVPKGCIWHSGFVMLITFSTCRDFEKGTACSPKPFSRHAPCLVWTSMNNIVCGGRKLKMQGCNLQESGIDLKALSACCLASKRPNMSQLNEKLRFFCAGNNKGVMPAPAPLAMVRAPKAEREGFIRSKCYTCLTSDLIPFLHVYLELQCNFSPCFNEREYSWRPKVERFRHGAGKGLLVKCNTELFNSLCGSHSDCLM